VTSGISRKSDDLWGTRCVDEDGELLVLLSKVVSSIVPVKKLIELLESDTSSLIDVPSGLCSDIDKLGRLTKLLSSFCRGESGSISRGDDKR